MRSRLRVTTKQPAAKYQIRLADRDSKSTEPLTYRAAKCFMRLHMSNLKSEER